MLFMLVACSQRALSVEPLTLKAVSLKGDPQIVFNTTNEELLVDITSSTGIGGAEIEKTAGQWPGKIVLRFHLQGLEEMEFHYGETTLQVNVISHDANPVSETVFKNGETETLYPGNLLNAQYWMGVQILNADGSPGSIPLNNGYIDVTVPPDFFRSKETKFTTSWIDFYR
jgi:hypothetical protein